MSLTSIFVKYQAIYTILGLISMLIIYSMLPFIISNSLYNEDTNKIILILLFGNLINLMTGPVLQFLQLDDQEGKSLFITVIISILILILVLIYGDSVYSISIFYSIGVALTNIMLLAIAWRRIFFKNII